jgi:hypothetical protein
MGAKTKAARKIRAAEEFDPGRLSAALGLPKDGGVSVTSWTLAEIFNARDLQMRGSFYLPARMAESMRTDDALSVAYDNRLDPQRCVPVEIVAAQGARGASVAAEARALFGQGGVGIHPDTMADINGCLVDHGVAFGVNVATPREDGSRVDFEMKHWPIEYVRWDPVVRCFKARVDPESVPSSEVSAADLNAGLFGFVGGYEVPIIHGDGRWVIFQKHEITPFKHGAILAAAIVWARHAYAIRDWSKGSVAHGSAKVIGTMPTGVALQNSSGGGLTPEATAMAALLRSIGTSDSPAGIKPAGSTIDFLTNSSTAWQVWQELVANAEKAAARIYLGTDGTLGTQGGAPGVDIGALFGVATTKVQGDFAAIERGLRTGVIEPWCAMNFGDSSLAPTRRYMLPDSDADALKKSLADRTAAFSAALKGLHDAGVALTQEHVSGLAADFGVRAPILPVAPSPAAVVSPAALRAVT